MCFGGGRWRQKRERNAHANPLPFPNLHTQAAASLRLIGDAGESDEYVLGEFFGVCGGRGRFDHASPRSHPFPSPPLHPPSPQTGNDQDEFGFERGSIKRYALPVRRPIGRVRRVVVAQLPPAADEAGTAWYLDRVVVTPPGGGGGGGDTTPSSSPPPPITFPCAAWLGTSHDGGDGTPPDAVAVRDLVPKGAGPAPGAASTPASARPAAATTAAAAFATTPPANAHPAASASLTFDVGGAALPHPEKVARDGARATCRSAGGWAGEDAYFVARLPCGGAGLGVSDGVWMWRLHGIDAGAFSRALMRHAAASLTAGETDPGAALATAEACTLGAGVQGSATACVVRLDARGALAAANVGDSGFAVVGAPPYYSGGGRHDQASSSASSSPSSSAHRRVIKFRSPQQEHEFGRPYQLGHHAGADTTADAMRTALPLAPGDVVVLGSDGLWDNLDDDGLLAAVADADAARELAAALARRLASAAFDGSVDKKRATPYSIAATEELGMIYSGGKADDITVVCARVRGIWR